MEYHHDLGLGLIWFTGDLACHVFDEERPKGECMTRPGGLLSDHRYLTNLSYKKYFDFLDEHPEIGQHLCMDATLIVSARTLAEEIGMPRFEQTQDPEQFHELLETLFHVYLHVCRRGNIDPLTIDFTPKGVREHVFYNTTNGAIRAVTDSEVVEGLSVKPHRWVNTTTKLPDGAFRRRITVSRYHLYRFLLSKPMPAGDWVDGDTGASMEAMLSARTESHDILVRGRLKDLPRSGFPDQVTADDARRYFTGAELAYIAESGRDIDVLGWWHGDLEVPPALPETNSMSLADAVLLEIMHRSWRENRGTGFWLAVAERMHLQELAYKMHQAGIPVLGYGSGKIVIATPEDREDKTARQEQDALLLSEFSAYRVQPPLEHVVDHPDLGMLTDHLTDLQAIALAGPRLLAKLEGTLTTGDGEAFDACINEAEIELEKVLGAYAGEPETPETPVTPEEPPESVEVDAPAEADDDEVSEADEAGVTPDDKENH